MILASSGRAHKTRSWRRSRGSSFRPVGAVSGELEEASRLTLCSISGTISGTVQDTSGTWEWRREVAPATCKGHRTI
ncbi:hypothetical protein OE88DRAFT_286392 [Heliocybe sulcata]|uniref:Uncharacterized protein n=1 Tax=Heliocybe sulcata TaxID=5364 RepID=A0A5C3N0K6_9AGAM|nr:hypothetical protein OE88DRAFT_286392 [Heliocybe sulcata]